jgi:hypothetical protein
MKTLLEQWQDSLYKNEDFWKNYQGKEKQAYITLLNIDKHPILGTVKDFSNKFNMDIIEFIGFLYGLNDSLKTPNNMEELTEDSIITLDYDENLLYKNMMSVGYDMSIWNNYSKPLSNPNLTPQQIAQANAQAQDWLNKVHCPYCNSTNCKKISGVSKATSVAMFGIFSQKVKKQWHCNNCKSDF